MYKPSNEKRLFVVLASTVRRSKMRWIARHLLGLYLAIFAYGHWNAQAGEVYHANETVGDESDIIFDPTSLEPLQLTMDPNDWESVRQGEDRWFRATVLYRDVQLDEVAIKARSRLMNPPNYTHPNLHIDFARYRPEQRLFGQIRLSTESWAEDDNTLVNQKLGQGLMRDFGVPAPRAGHMKLYVNGEYIGVYVVMDRVNHQMVGRFFSDNSDNLYKLDNTAGILPNNDGFLLNPDNPDSMESYLFSPVEPWNQDGRDILEVVYALNSSPEEIRERVDRVLDINNLINYLAVDMSLADTDGLISYDPPPDFQYYQNNVYLYHDPITGRFFLLVDTDLDGAFWSTDPNSVNRNLVDGWDQMTITLFLCNQADLMDQYSARVRDFLDQLYIPDRLLQIINQTADLIREAVYEDVNKPLSNEEWELYVQNLRNYVVQREANVRAQLEGGPLRCFPPSRKN